jgi:hypothetical protein
MRQRVYRFVLLGIAVVATTSAMAGAAGLGVPASLQDVYGVVELAALALAGLAIAVAGALLPAGGRRSREPPRRYEPSR